MDSLEGSVSPQAIEIIAPLLRRTVMINPFPSSFSFSSTIMFDFGAAALHLNLIRATRRESTCEGNYYQLPQRGGTTTNII
jgi:hypothetical protein